MIRRALLVLTLIRGYRRRPGRTRGLGVALGRLDLRAGVVAAGTGLCGWRGAKWRADVRQGVRHGRPRARCADHAEHALLSRVDLEAVHRDEHRAARARPPAVARRLAAEVGARGAELRRGDHAAPTAASHERPARLLHAARRVGMAERRAAHRAAASRARRRGRKVSTFSPATSFSTATPATRCSSIVVRRASGQSLREFADARIFKPLGMTHTAFRDDHASLIPQRALGYQPRASGYRLSQPEFDVVGDGGAYSTVEDLAKWDANFATGRVGGREWHRARWSARAN